MTADRRALAPQLLLLLAIAIWGGAFTAVKVPLDRGVPPMALLAARFWLALLCLLPLALRAGRGGALRTEAARGLATGAVLLLGYVLQTFGMQHATASVAGFVTALITLLVAVGAVLVFGERLRWPVGLGLVLGTVGTVMLCNGGEAAPDPAAADASAWGFAMLLGSSVAYAAHILMLSRLARPGRETVFCWWQFVAVAVGVSLLLPLGGLGDVGTWGRDPTVLLCIGYLGIFALVIGISIQARTQPRLKQTQVAVLFALQPLFAALGGALLLDERMSAVEWAGGAVIAAGVLAAQLLGRRRRAVVPA